MTFLLGCGWWRGGRTHALVLAILLTLGLAGGALDAQARQTVGNQAKADVVLQIGDAQWHLEPVPDQALVRFAGGKTAAAHRAAAGGPLWKELETLPHNPGENVSLVRATSESARALAAAAGTLPRALAGDPGVALVGPVYKVADREVGIADTLCLKFKPGVEPDAQAALVQQYGLIVVKSSAENQGVWKLAAATNDGTDTLWLCQALSKESDVEWVSPNFFTVYEKFSDPDSWVTDSLFTYQWHLYTPDPLVNSQRIPAMPAAAINAPGAWAVTQGNNDLIVAVLDDGVDPTHPDLQVLPGFDAVDGIGDGRPEVNGDAHGTAVAGVIAARLNGFGVVGVAPNVKILPVRLITGGPLSDDQIRAAHLFAVNQGASIINNSWGVPHVNDPCTTDDDLTPHRPIGPIVGNALNYALTFGRGGLGTVVVFAAGNSRAKMDRDELNGHPLVVTVAASNNVARRSWYSNYGAGIDVCAPSNDFMPDVSCASSIWEQGTMSITTTDPMIVEGYGSAAYPAGYTDSFGGTSSAAPTVAGVAALILSVNPGLRHGEVMDVLKRTATKIDPVGGRYDAAGHSIYYGHGRVDAAAAVQRAATQTGPLSRFLLEGWAGYSAINGLGDIDNLVATAERQTAVSGLYGFVGISVNGRRLFVSPQLLNIDSRGIITGIATIVGFEPDGKMVRMGDIPVRGRARVSAQGATYQRIVVDNAFRITGSGVIAIGEAEHETATAGTIAPLNPTKVIPRKVFVPSPPGPVRTIGSVNLVGRQRYVVQPDQPLAIPAFDTQGRVAISRFGAARVNAVTGGLVRHSGYITSTNLAPANVRGTVWTGDGVLTTDFGRFEGGVMRAALSTAVPERDRPGMARVTARNGAFAARSAGYHNVAFHTLTDIAPIEEQFDPIVVVFRGPAGGISIRLQR